MLCVDSESGRLVDPVDWARGRLRQLHDVGSDLPPGADGKSVEFLVLADELERFKRQVAEASVPIDDGGRIMAWIEFCRSTAPDNGGVDPERWKNAQKWNFVDLIEFLQTPKMTRRN